VVATVNDTTFSLVGGGAFSLVSADIGLGVYSTPGDTTITGNLLGGGTLSTILSIGAGPLTTYNFGWSNLTSVTFSSLSTGNYLAFDNIVVNAAVPEPAVWLTMLSGMAIAGQALRRRRQAYRLTAG
jgi:hypothetical protein